MGRKKKKPMKPWCWYCERDFEDDKVLVMHQKAKHFKCHVCHKKMYTAPGLVLHAMQVHKENITAIPNCLPNRNNLELEIVGMDGIPEEDMRAYKEKKNYREDGASAPKRPAFDPTAFIVPPIVPTLSAPAAAPSFNTVPPSAPQPTFGVPLPPGGSLVPPPGVSLNSVPPPMPPSLPMPAAMSNSASILSAPAGPVLPPEVPKPLFPSAQPTETARPPPLMSFNPLEASAGTVAQAAPITSAGIPPTGKSVGGSATSRIVHPEEDISLEELRSCLAKYHQNIGSTQPPLIKQPINVAAELGPAYSNNVAVSYQQQY